MAKKQKRKKEPPREDPFIFQLYNRYRDSSWIELGGEIFQHQGDAVIRASELSCDGIAYGMIKVVNLDSQKVVAVFPAGSKGKQIPNHELDRYR
jgi:hypothetical protein